MDQVTLSAEPRHAEGSRAARRLRRSGDVPAVVYGRDLESVTIAVSEQELAAALRTDAGLNALINLEVDGTKVLTVAREIQRHPVRGSITHLDFIQVSLDEPIQADVSIEYLGTPVGVVDDGGVVETIQTTVSLRALPTEIPGAIELDISHLQVGDTLLVSDLPQIEGVTYLGDAERPLVTVLIPRAIEEPVEEEEELLEGEELAEGEEAEGAEGDGSERESAGADGSED